MKSASATLVWNFQGIAIINNALKNAPEWPVENALNFKLKKCIQCTFSFKSNADFGCKRLKNNPYAF